MPVPPFEKLLYQYIEPGGRHSCGAECSSPCTRARLPAHDERGAVRQRVETRGGLQQRLSVIVKGQTTALGRNRHVSHGCHTASTVPGSGKQHS
mmetsp:Transcript_36264/g.65100  ORF Transcript_36264/g.65100 Transcript_36264/m.65100 type:complete len:94 (+) Transcript_36264:216-497(+)